MKKAIQSMLLMTAFLPLASCNDNKTYTCTNERWYKGSEQPKVEKLADIGVFSKQCEVAGKSVGNSCSDLIRSYIANGYSCKEDNVAK
jgi:hypothetical protein